MNKFLIGAMTLLTGTVLSVSSLKAQEVNKDSGNYTQLSSIGRKAFDYS